MVIDASILRTDRDNSDWGLIADKIEGSGGKIVQASCDHDAGQQLLGIGGAMALLRWKLE